jgi:hypothetical protein
MSRINAAIGANVRAEIARHGRTQQGAGTVLHLPQGSVSKRISGDTDWKVSELLILADWLGVTVDDFLVGLPRLDSNQEPAGYLPTVAPVYLANPKTSVNLPPFPADIPTNAKAA